MQIIKLKNNKIKLVAEEGKIICSKNKEKNENYVETKQLYLGKNDSVNNYEEVQAIEETTEVTDTNVGSIEETTENVETVETTEGTSTEESVVE